jgi:hypothetical protein
MPYIVPQALVFQEFNLVPAEITDPLRALIAGPHAYLLRYAEADEKGLGALGAYDADDDQSYAWPTKPVGSTIDESYVKLFMEDAKLVLFEDLIAADEIVAPVEGYRNRIRRAGSGGFAQNGDYARITELYDRDVRRGDRVYLRGVADGDEFELNTYVLDIVGEAVAATVGEVELAEANPEDQNVSATTSTVSGSSPGVTFAANAANYNGLVDGYINDTYTITVTASSVDDDHTTAKLKVTTASGLDEDDELIPGTNGSLFDVGERGLRISFTGAADLVVGTVYRVVVQSAFEQALAVSGGTYSGARDTTYIVEVTRGGEFDDEDEDKRPQVTVRTVHGVDASNGPVNVTGDNVAVAVGTKGVTITFYGGGAESSSVDEDTQLLDPVVGLRKGDIYFIDVTAQAEGRMSTLVLGHNLPGEMDEAEDLDLQIYLLKDLEIDKNRAGYDPLVNWEVSQSQLTVNSGIVAYDTTWTDGGELIPVVITSGDLFVEYRAWRSELASDVVSAVDEDELNDQVSGPIHPDNPLKYGMYKALANANGTAVKGVGIAEPDEDDSWAEALELLVGREDVYNLAPMTQSRSVQNLFAGHVNSQSSAEAGRWRAAFFNVAAVTETVKVSAATSSDEEEVLATLVDDPDSDGTQYTLLQVSSGNASVLELGARPGDIVRMLFGTSFGEQTYEEFVIDSIPNEETIKLVSGHTSAINSPEKIEIWHPMTKNEIAANVGEQAGSFGNRRVKVVWPDTVISGGLEVAGYYLAAALAGLRSGVVPHQGLTNLPVTGFDSVPRSTSYFNSTQLNTMAEAGTWVVTAGRDGTVYTRHALTTDNTDVNTREEQVVSNVDSISYLFRRRLSPYIGISNVTPGTLSLLRVEVLNCIEFLKANGFVERLGGQLIEGEIVRLEAHDILPDRVVIVINLTIGYPLNNIETYLVI